MALALLAVAIKTSLIVAIGLIAVHVLHRRSAAVRHWALASAIVCAGGAPLLSLALPRWTIPTHRTSKSEHVSANGSVAPSRATEKKPASPLAPGSDPATARIDISRLIMPVWVAGAVLNGSVLLIGLSRLRRLRSGRPASSLPIESLQRLLDVCGARRPVTLVQSDRFHVPVTWGVVWPKILLPRDVESWPRARLEAVLAHELAHVTRGDWLVQIVGETVKAIYWFNPLLWYACARLRYESECACDDIVMKTGVDRSAYATELLELARRFGARQQQWLPAPAMAVRPSNLERRVRAMLNAHLERGPITRRGRWVSALVFLGVTLPIVSFAQGPFSTLSGLVVDQQDRVVPRAIVTLTDPQRDVRHETKTDANGRFELVGLPPGDYTYEAKLPGFRTFSASVTLNGETVDRTLRMQVSSLQETVRVMSDSGAITTAQQRGGVFAKRRVSSCQGNDSTAAVGGRIRPPRKVKDVAPGYPGVEGDVELAATIGTDGSVVDVQVVKAERPELAPAAIEAVRQWEFDSTLLNCVPIEVQMNVSVSFRKAR